MRLKNGLSLPKQATLEFNGEVSGLKNMQNVTAKINSVTSSTVCTILYSKGDVS